MFSPAEKDPGDTVPGTNEQGPIPRQPQLAHIAQLEAISTDLKEARRTALNLMEDTILSAMALQLSEEKYRTLFTSIDEGFCIIEVLFDGQNNPVDYQFLEINPAFIRQTGLHNPVGKKIKDLVPQMENFWYETYGDVARKGNPSRFEHFAAHLAGGTWYDVYAFPYGGPASNQVAVVFKDITERKNQEQGQQFLLQLTDAIRPLTNPVELQELAMKLLGEYLQVMRATYFEVQPDQDTFSLTARYEKDALPMPNTMRMSDFSPDLAAGYRSGRTLLVRETENEPLREAYRAIGVRAWAAVPLVKNGLLVAIVGIQSGIPHDWSATELLILEALAERTWAAVELAKAEKALRVSEEKYRTLFDNMDEGLNIVDLVYDGSGNVADFRYVQVNKAFEYHTGLLNVTGRLGSETAPHTEENWLKAYDNVLKTGLPQRFENFNEYTGRWYNVYSSRIHNGEKFLV